VAEVHCEETDENSSRVAYGITGPCSSGFRCSKKLSAYLKSFKDNYGKRQ
jgi:hypothetical protein